MKSVLDKLLHKSKIENADYFCSMTSLLTISNPTNGSILQQRVRNICVELIYGISLTKKIVFNVDIDSNESCFVQASPGIKNRKFRFFVFNDIHSDVF